MSAISSFWFPGGDESQAYVVEHSTEPTGVRASDVYIVAQYVAVLTIIRAILHVVLFAPLANRLVPKMAKLSPEKRAKKVLKFSEAAWQSIFYWVNLCFGVYAVYDKEWAYNTPLCWRDYPDHPVPDELRFYYFTTAAFYAHMIAAIFFETKRKDFWEMFSHHVATLLLIYYSYMTQLLRLGSLVMLVHDVADPFLQVGKLFNYLKFPKTSEAIFTVFAIVFGVSRLFIFPFYIIYSAAVESVQEAPTWRAWHVFNGLLLVLLGLHAFWFSIIVKMAIRLMFEGDLGADARESDSSGADDKED